MVSSIWSRQQNIRKMRAKRVGGPRRAAGGAQKGHRGPKRAAEVPRTGQGARQHGPQEAKTHVKMQVLRPGRKVDLFARAISKHDKTF